MNEPGEASEPGKPPRPGAWPPGVLRLNRHAFRADQLLVMAVMNDAPGSTWEPAGAVERVRAVVAEGADIVGIDAAGGPGAVPDGHEEVRRIVPFIAAVRDAYPDLAISVDTRWEEVAAEACAVGADLLVDGGDGRMAEVAAAHRAGLVCSPAGALKRVAGAVAAGVDPARILLGPADSPGANTWRWPEITWQFPDLAATGWPVLVSVSDEDFTGADQRAGALAATAVLAWLGARVFRVDHVRETRRVLRMVAAIRGDIPPVSAVRGLA
jgi:dihydropteroate synthase